MSSECMLLGSVSLHKEDLEWWHWSSSLGHAVFTGQTGHSSQVPTDCAIALRQISTVCYSFIFYLDNSRQNPSETWGRFPAQLWERPFRLLVMWCSSRGPPQWTSQLEGTLSSAWGPHSWVPDLPCSVFYRLFPFLVF